MAQQVLKRRPSLKDLENLQLADMRVVTQMTLKETIVWQQFARSGLITDAEAGLMLDIDKKGAGEQKDILSEQGPAYANLFVKLLSSINADDALKYILALLGELLEAFPERAADWAALQREQKKPYEQLLRILQRQVQPEKEYIIDRSSQILSMLLGCRDVPADVLEIGEYIVFLRGRMGSPKPPAVLNALVALKSLLKREDVCVVFVREGGLRDLSNMLRKDSVLQNPQILYLVVFNFWLLSFQPNLLQDIYECDTVSKMVDLLKMTIREKVTRVVFATFRNFLDHPNFNEAMVVTGLAKLMPTLLSRKWNDEDVIENLTVVDDTLQKYVNALSSFDKYQTEILSGSLHWSPVHNEKFWRENVQRFEEERFRLVQLLINMLASEDELTLEVACYDLGEFARFHEDGRRIVDKLGGKRKLMALMSHKSSKVAKMALLSVQKLMVQNWESLNAGPKQ